MICAAHFNGPSAPQLAQQMVLLIRSRYHMPAYVFNYADEERKKAAEPSSKSRCPRSSIRRPLRGEIVVPIPRHMLTIRVEEQCAVLIGGYPDENAAHTALLYVKKLPPPELKVPEGALRRSTSSSTTAARQVLNPFSAQSMVVRNPTVPHETHVMNPKDDPFLKTLNADEEYSMLRCPGKWTLAVKEYMGASAVENKPTGFGPVQSMFGGKSKMGESLALAANNAHELAKTLRQLKFRRLCAAHAHEQRRVHRRL